MEIKDAKLKFKSLTKRKKTTHIFLHCTATPQGRDYKPMEIHNMHLKNGWSGCGYQFLVLRDGTIYECRPADCVGSHASNYNSTSVGVCYVGGMDANMKHAMDTRTVEQKYAMYELVAMLMQKYDITLDKVWCHNMVSTKACPSFKKEDFDKEFIDWTRKAH